MGNVAIFGGTFNPVHWGHLVIAEAAVSQFQLDRVLWVPTHHPPHKRQALTQFGHRLAMVQRAIVDNPSFAASDVEAQRSGPSYAIDTFQSLRVLQANDQAADQWHWIVGEDAFRSLPKWRGIEELAAHCNWLVAPRNSMESVASSPSSSPASSPVLEQFDRSGLLRYYWIETPTVEISSSLVRHYCQQGRSIRYLVPDAVRCYIQQHQLF